MSARIRTQYFDSRFVYIWKVVYIQKTKLRVAITNIWRNWRSNSVFLDLILLHFTPVASYTFYCPSWRSTANSSSATLSGICFWIFLPSGIQSGEETDVGRQRLNRALKSLFTFTHLLFRTKQDAWHKLIHLMKGSDFPSRLACSRLSDSGEEAKEKVREKLAGRKKGKRKGERASTHLF